MLKRFYFLIILVIAYLTGLALGIFCGINDFFIINESNITENVETSLNLNLLAQFDRAIYIAKNNFIVALKILIFGIFSFGIFSAILIFYNGFILGVAIGESLKLLSINIIAKSTLPHCGEILGLIICGYVGYILSMFLIFRVKYCSIYSIFKWCMLGFTLIIVSAFIESYISFPSNSSF